MRNLRAMIATAPGLHSPATRSDVEAFEKAHCASLPAEYRQFVLELADGGKIGPEFGLLPFGVVPPYWAELHQYSERLARPFPLSVAWVWEDEDLTPEREQRVDAVDDGVLLLGEEGCGARWVLVVDGAHRGYVWLATGEGATPCTPPMRFDEWLMALIEEPLWWYDLVANWGPERNIWFAAHAAKQLAVAHLDEKRPTAINFAQTNPLCVDCRAFLRRLAAHEGLEINVRTPAEDWLFTATTPEVRRRRA